LVVVVLVAEAVEAAAAAADLQAKNSEDRLAQDTPGQQLPSFQSW